jgi:hypothetical protein
MEIPRTIVEWNDEQYWYYGTTNNIGSMELGTILLPWNYEQQL